MSPKELSCPGCLNRDLADISHFGSSCSLRPQHCHGCQHELLGSETHLSHHVCVFTNYMNFPAFDKSGLFRDRIKDLYVFGRNVNKVAHLEGDILDGVKPAGDTPSGTVKFGNVTSIYQTDDDLITDKPKEVSKSPKKPILKKSRAEAIKNLRLSFTKLNTDKTNEGPSLITPKKTAVKKTKASAIKKFTKPESSIGLKDSSKANNARKKQDQKKKRPVLRKLVFDAIDEMIPDTDNDTVIVPEPASTQQ